jgi:hypothetical protein
MPTSCTNAPVTLTQVDVEALVRLLTRGSSIKKRRAMLEWLYAIRDVPRPDERTTPSDVLDLGATRGLSLKVEQGAAVAALVDSAVTEERAALMGFARALERNIEIDERMKALKARK